MKNQFLSKSSDDPNDVLKNLSTRTYNRYDDRGAPYIGREDPSYVRDPAYNDQRYNSNYNSYRGNGKTTKNFFSPDPSRFADPINIFASPRTWFTGYDNLNPTYYEAMRDRFQRGKCLKHIWV